MDGILSRKEFYVVLDIPSPEIYEVRIERPPDSSKGRSNNVILRTTKTDQKFEIDYFAIPREYLEGCDLKNGCHVKCLGAYKDGKNVVLSLESSIHIDACSAKKALNEAMLSRERNRLINQRIKSGHYNSKKGVPWGDLQ